MLGLMPYKKRERQEFALSPPPEDMARRQPSANQEAGPHRTPNLPAPCSWTSCLQNCEKEMSVIKVIQSVAFCHKQPELQQQGNGSPFGEHRLRTG